MDQAVGINVITLKFKNWRFCMNFNITKNIGMLLLAIWLILMGLAALVPAIASLVSSAIFALLAIAAGVFILIGR